ncbi:MAG: (Fe-S)-binding protein [Chloroflexi bacterium]|nr:(Fe-S)-binding protein [Chloroflexota bacterium]
MPLPKRESPKGKAVSLFVTCMVDMLHPETGLSVVQVLEYLGVEVNFPEKQTCCGQPAYNGGYHDEAKAVAIEFLKVFRDAEVIVAPSGSCATMVRVDYPKLFADDPKYLSEAERISSITWEFSEFLVDGLGIENLDGILPEAQSFAFHDSCHGLRMMGIKDAPRKLVGNIENAEILPLDRAEECCGFGGLFSIKLPNVSAAITDKKLASIKKNAADWILLGDVSCMTNMNTALEKRGEAKRLRHFADVLAEAIPKSGAKRGENPDGE